MKSTERRRGRRVQPHPGQGETLIEIDHPYGPVRRSVYRVLEIDEHGLSFLIPAEHGYFLPGTPLRFSILERDKLRTRLVGICRYHHVRHSARGEKLHQVGVELRASLRSVPRQQFAVRPARLAGARCQALVVDLPLGERQRSFGLLDLSKYSAAFACPEEEALELRIGSVLAPARIRAGRRSVYQGPLIVTRTTPEAGGEVRVVVEPRRATIDVDAVRRTELAGSASAETERLIRRHEGYERISTTFKAMVADLRFFLEDFRDWLETPVFQAERREPVALLEEIFPLFFAKLDTKMVRLDRHVRGLGLSAEEWVAHKHYYQRHLLSLMLASPYNHRIYTKPKGYPGDFEMIRMVQRNRFEGSTPFGKLLNKYSTSIPVARAVRERTEHFARVLEDQLRRAPDSRIFSVASGPALELDALLRRQPDLAARASITLLDQEVEALEFSQEGLYAHRVRSGCGVRLSFVHATLGNYLRGLARQEPGPLFDLVYASGLFDYFEEKTSRFVLGRLASLLAPGGRLVVANLSLEGHDHSVFMEFAGEWRLVYRSAEELAQLAEGVPGCARATVGGVGGGLVKILELERA